METDTSLIRAQMQTIRTFIKRIGIIVAAVGIIAVFFFMIFGSHKPIRYLSATGPPPVAISFV